MKNKDTTFFETLAGLSILVMLSSMLILGYQLFEWLKTGSWLPLPLSLAVPYFPKALAEWIYNPTSWVGIHRIVIWFLDIPISLAIALVGFGMGGMFNYFDNVFKNQKNQDAVKKNSA